jgi:hypothetical protein
MKLMKKKITFIFKASFVIWFIVECHRSNSVQILRCGREFLLTVLIEVRDYNPLGGIVLN